MCCKYASNTSMHAGKKLLKKIIMHCGMFIRYFRVSNKKCRTNSFHKIFIGFNYFFKNCFSHLSISSGVMMPVYISTVKSAGLNMFS